MNLSSTENFQPGQQPNSEQKADNQHVSQSIANAMLAEVPEYVMCSAIWYRDLETQNLLPFNKANGIILCGWRHGNIIAQMKALTDLRTVKNGMSSVGEYEQGFLTNTNRFVSREEAGQIAFKAGQTKELKTYLFSEDVW